MIAYLLEHIVSYERKRKGISNIKTFCLDLHPIPAYFLYGLTIARVAELLHLSECLIGLRIEDELDLVD